MPYRRPGASSRVDRAATYRFSPRGRAPGRSLSVRAIGHNSDPDGTFATAFGLEDGGAALVRPDGIVAWRSVELPADPAVALQTAIETALGRGMDTSLTRGKEAA